MAKDYGAAVSQNGYDVKSCDDRFLVYSSAFPVLKIFSVQSLTGTIPTGNSADFTAATNDVITSNGHGLQNGDMVNFDTSGTLPAGLASYTTDALYYVIERATNTFKVSLTLGGSAVDITSTGSGTHTWYADTNRIRFTHNLGYFAPFILIYNGNTTDGQDNSYFMSNSNFGGFAYGVKQYENYIDITVDWIGEIGDTVYYTLYLFLDDFSTIAEKNVNTGTSSGASSTDYGIRISKEGFDVNTCEDKDCAMSSSFFTQIIHKRGVAAGDVSHNLGYVPSCLSYFEDSNYYGTYICWAAPQVSASYLYANAGDRYIIFKQKNN